MFRFNALCSHLLFAYSAVLFAANLQAQTNCVQSVSAFVTPFRAIPSQTTPTDSLGETVFEVQRKDQLDVASAPGAFIPPRLIKNVDPKFTREMRKRIGSTDVAINGVVSAKGKFIDASAAGSPDPDAAHSALQAISHYQFAPATLDEKPVAFKMRIEVHFGVFKDGKTAKQALALVKQNCPANETSSPKSGAQPASQ